MKKDGLMLAYMITLDMGIFLDPALNFKFHKNDLNKKLSKSLFCLRKCQSLLTETAMKCLYFLFFIVIWSMEFLFIPVLHQLILVTSKLSKKWL